MPRRRIERAIAQAVEAHRVLQSLSRASEKQAAWESFVIQWRRAFELQRKLLAATSPELAGKWFDESQKDPDLIYLWESGNAERHDPSGSSDLAGGSLKLKVVDPRRAASVEDVRFGSDGEVTYKNLVNGRWHVEEGNLVFRDIQTQRKGNPIVAAPKKQPHEISETGLNFITTIQRSMFAT